MVRTWNRWQDWVNVLAGAWLFISPWVFGIVAASVAWNFWVVGAVIFFITLWALYSPALVISEWFNAAIAVWLFVSPWVLGFAAGTPAIAWNAWAVAVVVFVMAVWVLSRLRRANPTV
ncbi:MAG: SPW repeat protein [Dehalococcoidales bacterium]|nr:SPW repeat protein [Dehalococcoidales bacterium]